MAKYKYVLTGPETGASGNLVMKELVVYEGDYLKLEDGLVKVQDMAAHEFTVAVIRLGEGQSLKRAD